MSDITETMTLADNVMIIKSRQVLMLWSNSDLRFKISSPCPCYLKFSMTSPCVSKQSMTMAVNVTDTETTDTTNAIVDVSGYSKVDQTNLCVKLVLGVVPVM